MSIILDKVTTVLRGEYDPARTYSRLDEVSYQGSSYGHSGLASDNVTPIGDITGVAPPARPWVLRAQKGEQGVPGAAVGSAVLVGGVQQASVSFTSDPQGQINTKYSSTNRPDSLQLKPPTGDIHTWLDGISGFAYVNADQQAHAPDNGWWHYQGMSYNNGLYQVIMAFSLSNSQNQQRILEKHYGTWGEWKRVSGNDTNVQANPAGTGFITWTPAQFVDFLASRGHIKANQTSYLVFHRSAAYEAVVSVPDIGTIPLIGATVTIINGGDSSRYDVIIRSLDNNTYRLTAENNNLRYIRELNDRDEFTVGNGAGGLVRVKNNGATDIARQLNFHNSLTDMRNNGACLQNESDDSLSVLQPGGNYGDINLRNVRFPINLAENASPDYVVSFKNNNTADGLALTRIDDIATGGLARGLKLMEEGSITTTMGAATATTGTVWDKPPGLYVFSYEYPNHGYAQFFLLWDGSEKSALSTQYSGGAALTFIYGVRVNFNNYGKIEFYSKEPNGLPIVGGAVLPYKAYNLSNET